MLKLWSITLNSLGFFLVRLAGWVIPLKRPALWRISHIWPPFLKLAHCLTLPWQSPSNTTTPNLGGWEWGLPHRVDVSTQGTMWAGITVTTLVYCRREGDSLTNIVLLLAGMWDGSIPSLQYPGWIIQGGFPFHVCCREHRVQCVRRYFLHQQKGCFHWCRAVATLIEESFHQPLTLGVRYA